MVQGLSLPPIHLHGVWGVIQQFSIHALSTIRAEANAPCLGEKEFRFCSLHLAAPALPQCLGWTGSPITLLLTSPIPMAFCVPGQKLKPLHSRRVCVVVNHDLDSSLQGLKSFQEGDDLAFYPRGLG